MLTYAGTSFKEEVLVKEGMQGVPGGRGCSSEDCGDGHARVQGVQGIVGVVGRFSDTTYWLCNS